MRREKNEIFRVRIEDMSDTGEGIGKTDGFTLFVKDAVIGDLVEAKVMKVKKSYGFARLMKVLKPSPHRVTPPCPVASSCGGCQLQAMSYEEQLRFKERKVLNNLRRIGGLDCREIWEPIIGMEDPWHYRNKALFPIGRNKEGKIIMILLPLWKNHTLLLDVGHRSLLYRHNLPMSPCLLSSLLSLP